MKRLVSLALAALALGAGTLTTPRYASSQSAPGWPTFHGGMTRDGVLNVSGPMSDRELGRYSLNGLVNDSPVVDASGHAYVAAADGKVGQVFAFDPKQTNLQPMWTFQTSSLVEATPGLSPDGSKLFVGTDDGTVYALKAATGDQLWKINLGGPVHSSPVVSADGNTVYLATVSGAIEAVSASTGSVVWGPTQTGGSIPGSITLDPGGTILYIAQGLEEKLLAVPATGSGAGSTGTVYYLDAPPLGSPAVDPAGNIYVTSSKGSTLSFAPGTSGAARWQHTVSTVTQSLSTPAIGNGIVVVGNANGYIYGISASNGQQQWERPAGASVSSSAAIATGNGEAYIGSDNGTLYAIGLATGVVTWSRSLGVGISTSPALSPDGTLWVVSNDGQLFHFGTAALPSTPVQVTGVPSPTSGAATPGTTSTTVVPTPSPTTSVMPLTISAKSQVKDGQKQVVTIHSAANTAVSLRVDYPNGDHQSKKVTTNASGTATYSYTQGSSKTTHSHLNATIRAAVGSGSSQNQQTATYKIGFGPVDASVEPRTQKVGGTVQIYVHAKKGAHVRAVLSFPNGTVKRFNQTAGPKGFGHWTYKVGKNLTRGSNKTVTVQGSTVGQHPDHTTKTTFKIS